jgi:glycine cleavage system aminomethyltransferase T
LKLEKNITSWLLLLLTIEELRLVFLSWGQDLDAETYPFQCNLGYQVPRKKTADYIGKEALEAMRAKIEAGEKPYSNQLVGFVLGGRKLRNMHQIFG